MKNGRSFVQTLIAVAVGALILAAGPAWAAQEIRGKVSIESWSLVPKVGRYPILVTEFHSRPSAWSRVRVM